MNPLPLQQMINSNSHNLDNQQKQLDDDQHLIVDKLSKKDSIHQMSESDRLCRNPKTEKFNKQLMYGGRKLSSTIMNIGKTNKVNYEIGSSSIQ